MISTLGVARAPHPTTVVIKVDSVVPEFSSIDVMVAKASPAPSHPRYMTISVPVCKRESTRTIAGWFKKHFLNTAPEHTTAVVKEVGVLDVRKSAESLHLSPEAIIAQKELLAGKMMVSCVYVEDFQNLLERHEFQGDENLGESFDLLLCNYP